MVAARCYAQAQPMPLCSVWLRPVTFVYYVKMAKDTAIVSCYGMQIWNCTQAFQWYHF